jgi:hypothetical protein
MKCSPSYYNEFKKIRNRLRYYRKDQIVIICFENLTATWNLNIYEIIQNKKPLPWHTLLILKWGLVYGANKHEGKSFDQNNFNSIYYLINNLPACTKWLNVGDSLGVWKFMRATLYSQSIYQTNTGFYGLAITEIILKDIGINYDVDNSLKRILGVDLAEFTNFQSILTAIYTGSPKHQSYSLDYFITFTNRNNIEKLNHFLNYFSLKFNELESFMIEHHKAINNPEYEYNLLSPLNKKPLYRFNGKFIAYNKTLINHFCEYGLYDFLKSNDNDLFSGAFGYGFETYLTYSLDSLKLKYTREFDIRKIYNVKRSVDFFYEKDDDVLLIEAKSSEISELTTQNPEKKFLEQTFQNSLIKGYKQIFLTAFELKKQNPRKFARSNFWAIIVTFKDFLSGSPEVIWSEFMEENMMNILPKDIISNLPLDQLKIFVLSVYEFDSLCLYTKKRNSDLFSSLSIPFENNKARETKKLSFFMNYPQDEIKITEFDHIKVKFEEIKDRIKTYLE